MHFGLSLFFSLFCSSIYLFADGKKLGDLCAAMDTSSEQAGVTHNILSCSHSPCRPLELPSWFPSCIWWCIRYGCPCTNILRLIMQGHFFTWEKSLITDYGLPGTNVLYLPIVGFFTLTRMCYRGDNTVASWNQDMTDPGTKMQFENSSPKGINTLQKPLQSRN